MRAQYWLGIIYQEGKGIEQDYQQAIRWFTKAAQAGDADAQNSLGVMYANGEGVPQDYVQAHKWFNLAAAAETDKEKRGRAVKNRDLAAKKMSAMQIAEAQQLAREWKPTIAAALDRQQDTSRNEPAVSGTGFVVSRQGHVLTYNHVVHRCSSVRSTAEGREKQLIVVGRDVQNDLALLKLHDSVPIAGRFRDGRNIRPGDGVMVVGFPLHGLLATEANVTTGAVSALAGIGNNTRFLQITAPVQPGNSGGPLLDESGHIVGIVVSKLNALSIAEATGDIPQNINFAINGTVAKSFLESHSVEYEVGVSSERMEPC